MDRRSWLWRRRSSEKSPGETESSASASSLSERFSDEQDVLRVSPKYAQSPEMPSKEAEVDEESSEKVKALSERLSSAVLDIRARDDLVKQHSKVAEEAVLGWEKAEKEMAALRTQLNAATRKNCTLEDKIGHLDGALKECVRQLRRARDELAQRAREWESERAGIELQVTELKAKLEAKAELSVCSDSELGRKLSALEQENSDLKSELQLRTVEKELSTRTAEAASKQLLESIRKTGKLEAECRRLQAAPRRSASFHIELSDCQSDSRPALITELDQFKNDKCGTKSPSNADIGLMDDFLEMERLASASQSSPKAYDRVAELEDKAKRLSEEKAEQEKALHEARRELRVSRHRSAVAEEKSTELQRQLNLVNGEKHAIEAEMEALEVRRHELESELALAHGEIAKFDDKARVLEEQIEAEKALTLELAMKHQHMDALEAERAEMQLQLGAARTEARQSSDRISLLERRLEEEKAFSARLAAKCHGTELELEAARTDLQALGAQIKELESEVSDRDKKVRELKIIIEEEKVMSSELRANCSILETENAGRKELEIRFESAKAEIKNLEENVSLLEKKLGSQKELSAVYEAALDASEAQKSKMMSQVELGEKESEELRGKIRLLEEQVRRETALSSEYAAKCRDLEDQLSENTRNYRSRRHTADGDLQIKQEKERLARAAAGKLADCQTTIASLSRQLKSLATCDDLLLEIDSPDGCGGGDLKLFSSTNCPEQLDGLAVT